MPTKWIVLIGGVLLAAGPTFGLEALLGGKKAILKRGSSPDLGRGIVRFVGDAALQTLPDPTCAGGPNGATLRLSTSAQIGPPLALACGGWRRSGSGFRYDDPDALVGGVRKVLWKPGKLKIKLQGAGFDPPFVGPVTFVEVRLAAGTRELCGRFDSFTRSDAERISARGPTTACAVVCGDGIPETGEACDDGNGAVGDGCRPDCTLEACGDSVLDPGEDCDDGATADGDCCSAACAFEDGLPCSDGDLCTTADACLAGACQGALVRPWINEFDYDDFRFGGNQDSDEFVEIAGPTGTDLSGYQLVSVEGAQSCNTPVFGLVANGNAHFTTILPAGTVLGDDTGTGIGFLTVCFYYSSSTHNGAGECDLLLPAPYTDTNLQNGHLVNGDTFSCPDGVLLLDAGAQLVDAISYEGIVPNTGAYGGFFHVTPYNAGQDEGFKNRVSFEKTTSTLGRANAAAEWRLSGGCVTAGLVDLTCVENSDSPGELNPGQTLHCAELFCGDGLVSPGEECDAGVANSDAPDAGCRTDCTLRRCGDGIVDPGAAPQFPEQCETDADCGGGAVCFACACEPAATQLGALSFSVVPGPSAGAPTDDGQATWLRVTELFGMTNGTQGNFNSGPLLLAGGQPGPDGRAALILSAPVVLGANLPSLAGAGRVCMRLRQDPDYLGFVDCDGGSSAGVEVSMDSHGAGANGTPTLATGGGAAGGPGTALLRVLLEAGITEDSVTPCENATYAAPLRSAFTTATATSTIVNTSQGGATAVSLGGQPFDCGNWIENGGASIVGANLNPDVVLPLGLGTNDIAQVLRLNDD